MKPSSRTRFGIANWRVFSGIARISRSRIFPILLLAYIIGCYLGSALLFVPEDDVTLEPLSAADILVQLALVATLSLAMAAALVAAVLHLARLRNSRLHRDLISSLRYDRYGTMSAMVTAGVLAYWYMPIGVDFDVLVQAFGRFDMVLAHKVAIVGGFCLATCLGLVASLRPARVQRVIGALSLAVSADYLCTYLTYRHAWEVVRDEASLFAELVIGMPASFAYELTDANLGIGLVVFIAPFFVIWLACRKEIYAALAQRKLQFNRHRT